MAIYQHFTVWFFLPNREGELEGKKTYWSFSSPKTVQEMADYIMAKYPDAQDILIWEGNWFGLSYDNLPEPDEKYGIKPERED